MSTLTGCPLPPRRDHQREFWRSIRAGLSAEDAAACLGAGKRSGTKWFGKAGGVPPMSLVEPVKARTLNIAEREKLLSGIHQGLSIRVIAAGIGRAPSTVSRELAQHMTHRYFRVPGRAGRPRLRGWDYSPNLAQRQADAAAARPKVANMVNISTRPPEVEDRAVPGHWEGDLIIGKNSGSAIGTLVERMTGFVMLLHLPEGHGADAVQEAMVNAMSQLPAVLKKTLTWDQGKEMSNHVQIAAATDLDIYFCDPHSPWQRGSNENTNGLLRQYFPKGSDLSVYAPDYLEHVATKLNNRPRKRHGWKTPAETLHELLSEPFNPPGVALTG